MVLEKRLDYGFNGYKVPATPRASRSARRRRLFYNRADGSKMCAFDLLATVAGELLQEKESCPSVVLPGVISSEKPESEAARNDSIKQEQKGEEHLFKHEPCDQGSCDESVSGFVLGQQRYNQDHFVKERSHSEIDLNLGLECGVIKSEKQDEAFCASKSVVRETNKLCENYSSVVHGVCHVERGSPGSAESHDGKMDGELGRRRSTINVTLPDILHWDDPMEINNKPPSLVSSDSSVEVPFYGTIDLCRSLSRCRDHVKVVSRDDDENSSGCTQPSTSTAKTFCLPRLGERKIRKLLASKYWKSGPTLLQKGEISCSELDRKPAFRSRKLCYTRQRTQRLSFKRRKVFERSSISTSLGGICGEVVSNSFEKGISREATGFRGTICHASRASSPTIGHKSTLESKDSSVKLRIKSFRVPELFIEIPESATIGSLKRAVLDAVISTLGGRLRVGVLLHGKKLKDDSRTLVQTGISHDVKPDCLGFTLEPTTVHPPPLKISEDTHSLLPRNSSQPINRYPLVPALDAGVSGASLELPMIISSNPTESNHVPVPFSADMSPEKTAQDSKALVAVPALSVEALAVVPFNRKSRRPEFVQRRMRRPFSVAEVEALVQAVEKLGTGRWRDVKLRAFENAKHRTYVDLKDKWKTLVHTARISPQQRRGEPVPQELLDRVLSAHAYWSQHQTKNHNKHQQQHQLLSSICS